MSGSLPAGAGAGARVLAYEIRSDQPSFVSQETHASQTVTPTSSISINDDDDHPGPPKADTKERGKWRPGLSRAGAGRKGVDKPTNAQSVVALAADSAPAALVSTATRGPAQPQRRRHSGWRGGGRWRTGGSELSRGAIAQGESANLTSAARSGEVFSGAGPPEKEMQGWSGRGARRKGHPRRFHDRHRHRSSHHDPHQGHHYHHNGDDDGRHQEQYVAENCDRTQLQEPTEQQHSREEFHLKRHSLSQESSTNNGRSGDEAGGSWLNVEGSTGVHGLKGCARKVSLDLKSGIETERRRFSSDVLQIEPFGAPTVTVNDVELLAPREKMQDRNAVALRKLLQAFGICFFFMVVEFAAGWIANSLALMTDAAHMLSDCSSFMISIFAIWVSTLPGTHKLSFGYHRAEILCALVSVVIIWILTALLLRGAYFRVLEPEPVDGKIMFITALVGTLANIFMTYILGVHSHGIGTHDHDHAHGCDGHRSYSNHTHGGHAHEHDDDGKHFDSHYAQLSHSLSPNIQHKWSSPPRPSSTPLALPPGREDDTYYAWLDHHHHHHLQSSPPVSAVAIGKVPVVLQSGGALSLNGRSICSRNPDWVVEPTATASESQHQQMESQQQKLPTPTSIRVSTVDVELKHLDQDTFPEQSALGGEKGSSTTVCYNSAEMESLLERRKNRGDGEADGDVPKPFTVYTEEGALKLLPSETQEFGKEASFMRVPDAVRADWRELVPTSEAIGSPSPIRFSPLQKRLSTGELRVIPTRDDAYHLQGEESRNVNLQAAYIHALGDLIQNVGVLVASLIIWLHPEASIADPICTMIFGVLVLFTTQSILREATNVLMEGTPTEVDMAALESDLLSIPSVVEIHDLHVWSLSVGKPALACHLVVNDEPRARKVLRVATHVVQKRYNILHTTIQIDFSQNKVACDTDAHAKCR